MDESLARRLEQIEERSAHQEHTLEELNQALCDQQKQLDRLLLVVQKLVDQVENLDSIAASSNAASAQPEVPPHY